jgi:3-methyladenine DNA glycosylase/8-oxoguanine DNA glycosylase
MPSCHDYCGFIDIEAPNSLQRVTLMTFRQGRNDPTFVLLDDSLWRATLTPMGPGTLRIKNPFSPHPKFEAFGPGAEWLINHGAELLGSCDSLTPITSVHASVTAAQRKHGHLLFGRSLTPYHELLPAVLGQRVTAIEALAQWRNIVNEWGDVAPGPVSELRLPPDPQRLAELPYFAFHKFGIEKKRADTLVAVARHSSWLMGNALHSIEPSAATLELQKIPGVGIWTASVAGALAFGDADALQVGDFHVKNTAAWALRGTPRGTDEEMIRDMQPYAGNRHRVMRWLELDGWRAPARGPRRRNVSITRL